MFPYLLAIALIYSYLIGIYNGYINYIFWVHTNQIDLEISILIVPNVLTIIILTILLALLCRRSSTVVTQGFHLIETNDTKFCVVFEFDVF